MIEPTTDPTPCPSSYSIEKLLSQTVQLFPDLSPEDFEVLKQSIKDRGLMNPVVLTEDGYLLDGHQRLKALLALGKKRIIADHVRIQEGVNRDNMIRHAYTSNMVRLMLTTKDKAARMHQCATMGWSQWRIAKEFHMPEPDVSQLMAAYPPEGTLPLVIVTQGEDGKTYTPMPCGAVPKPNPWAFNGESFKVIQKARKLLATGVPSGLDQTGKRYLADELDGLAEAIEKFQQRMETM
jgi:ParB-like nuclease family protein